MKKEKRKWWDKSITLVEGCKPISPGCAHCWSAAMTHRFHQGKGLTANGHFNGKIICREDRIGEILKRKKPTRWTIWNDLFNKKVPFEFIYKVIAISMICKRHTLLFLTKRPKGMLKCFTGLYSAKNNNTEAKMWDNARKWLRGICKPELREYIGVMMAYPIPPKNIHLGVTICNQKEADEKIPILLQIPAVYRWLSIEPCLGPVDLKWNIVYPSQRCSSHIRNEPPMRGIDRIVVGCESGPKRRLCKLEWIKSIVDQGKAANVPVFVKQMEINGKVSHNPAEWPVWAREREVI